MRTPPARRRTQARGRQHPERGELQGASAPPDSRDPFREGRRFLTRVGRVLLKGVGELLLAFLLHRGVDTAIPFGALLDGAGCASLCHGPASTDRSY